MATNNALNAPLPLSIAQGGTNNNATPVTGGVVYFDGTRMNTTSFVEMNSSGIYLGNAVFGFQGNLNQDRYYILDTANGSKIASSGVGSTFSFDFYAGLWTTSGGGVSTGQYTWHTVDGTGGAWQTIMSLSNSGVLNLPNLSASLPVFTDGSKNLTSTGTVPIAHGGTNQTSFNSVVNAGAPVIFFNGTSQTNDASFGYDTNFDLLKIYSSLANPQFAVKTTLTGSANSASDVLDRGDQANGGTYNYHLTAGTSNWQNGMYSGSNDFVFKNPSTAVLTLGNSTTDVTANSGNLIVNTAGKTVKIKQGSNACAGTGVTLSSGTATVSTTAVATGDIVLITKTANGGTTTTGMPAVSISNGVSFTLTGSSLDTSTYSWVIIKAA